VVFDVLRATTSMLTALANGASAVFPVSTIEEAVGRRRMDPSVLLAGERGGRRIREGAEFDLGNSPREFSREAVGGRTIVMTTTNGTRALRACSRAARTLAGAFLNMGALVREIRRMRPQSLLVVCGGTMDQAALEDAAAAGMLCRGVWSDFDEFSDSAVMARRLYEGLNGDLLGAMRLSRNGRRLLADEALKDDVPACLGTDSLDLIAELQGDGGVRAAGLPPNPRRKAAAVGEKENDHVQD
jgi:2-phosphosulfolactate phosphatase